MTQPDTTPPAPATDAVEPLPPLPRRTLVGRVRDYCCGQDPTLLAALVPSCFLSMVLYTRHPATNFIFDEQEALLANPYVRSAADPKSSIRWAEAFRRDFWGLTPERTIGSYRPLPDIVWRALWKAGLREQGAFPHDYLNVLLHGLNGALVVLLVHAWTRNRLTAWLAGGLFVTTAVVTEAVSGVVGLADVLGGAGALLALLALSQPLAVMPFALLGATLLALYSKESALCLVPLVPLAALYTSQVTHADRPRRWTRMAVAALTVGAGFMFYVEMRRRWFPVATPQELTAAANVGKPLLHRAFAAALRWYAQPMLPHDPLNNPLIEASPRYRLAGALRVYARGLGQVVFPHALSGDYSAPQEPVPTRLVFPESVIGGVALVLPLVAAPVVGLVSWWRGRRRGQELADAGERCGEKSGTLSIERSSQDLCPAPGLDLAPVVAFALVWIVLSYFPVSNIPVLLPTVRAERFWYFPAIGSAMVLAVGFVRLFSAARRGAELATAVALFLLFVGFQCFAARRHAFDYTNDLTFWDATRKAVPRSAKAHLNYSVMLGARGDLEGRLASNEVALRLAPQWPMANVYEGDTLCRLHRAPEGMPHYLRGFSLGPNDMSLIALGLQCLWDEHQLAEGSVARAELQDIADANPGSWLKYLVDDTFASGDSYKGVNPKYRPRGYNEGPKKDE
ncbi:MAG: tetratricopeptide repeat protein [Myxococcota bacterium]|nr:tetratricopeptide repeat protein [Myxococcota bacterium]